MLKLLIYLHLFTKIFLLVTKRIIRKNHYLPSFAEPFVEAVPQTLMLLSISYLSGWSLKNGNEIIFGVCLPKNCGIASLYFEGMKPKDWFFLATFVTSILSASFGVTRFLKNGPMTLMPRNKFGPSFLLAMLIVGASLIGKGVILATLLKDSSSLDFYNEGFRTVVSTERISSIGVWIGVCLIPHLVVVSID